MSLRSLVFAHASVHVEIAYFTSPFPLLHPFHYFTLLPLAFLLTVRSFPLLLSHSKAAADCGRLVHKPSVPCLVVSDSASLRIGPAWPSSNHSWMLLTSSVPPVFDKFKWYVSSTGYFAPAPIAELLDDTNIPGSVGNLTSRLPHNT